MLRVARPTGDIARLMPFYRGGLGLDLLAAFEGHAGYDGAILGLPGAAWHLEFTRHPDHPGAPPPTEENLLVLYPGGDRAWRAACGRMEAAGFAPLPACNPYWNDRGRTYEDPDGWRTVLTARSWDR